MLVNLGQIQNAISHNLQLLQPNVTLQTSLLLTLSVCYIHTIAVT